MSEALHVNAHAARAARDRAHRSLEIGRRQIRLLDLGDLLELRTRDLADLVRVGCAAALFDPLALRMSTAAGGVFMMKVKLRSEYAVITTGIGRPFSSFAVCALNCLQNSMMFTPCWPSAGPIGGDGLA